MLENATVSVFETIDPPAGNWDMEGELT